MLVASQPYPGKCILRTLVISRLQKYRQQKLHPNIIVNLENLPIFALNLDKSAENSFKNALRQKNILTTMTEILDSTDLQLLKLLQKNAKLTTKELADAVNLTPTPVFERLRRLEKQGYIKKYVAILDAEKLNRSMLVFCKVKLKQINRQMADAFTHRIRLIPEVTECYNISGAYDYLLKIRTADMKQYQDFLLNKLGDAETVGSIESTFVMSEIKQSYGVNF